MNNITKSESEAKRAKLTGKITRAMMANSRADAADIAKETHLPVTTVKRLWDDACRAMTICKSQMRLGMSNPPRSIQVAGMKVSYSPQDYDNEFMGGSYRANELPEVYIYARQDDMRLGCTYEVTGYEINWGCCGAVKPELFEQWAALCAFVSAQVRELESRLATARQLAASVEASQAEEK